MIQFNYNLTNLFFLLTLTFLSWSCVDQNFDEPPVPGLPNIEANTTIAALKALHTIGDDDDLITDDFIISGIVVADDRSGNFFKSLIIQDQTGGLDIRINTTDLYNDFPIGMRIFVRCKDLYIGDFNGVY
ncbi:MAG: DUF5689 domain-containing protein, partial [Bacteroidota bacterium]